jgi:hypothetical protein
MSVTLKNMTAAVKQLNSESYKELIEECNEGSFISVSALTRDTKNRKLLEKVYAKANRLPSLLAFESDSDNDDDDDITLGSVTSKGGLGLEEQLKSLTIENTKLKKEIRALTGAASSDKKKKPTPHFKTLEEIQKMTGVQMNVHIDTLKDEYGEDAFKAAVKRMNTNMTGIKKAAVNERASLIVDLQEQLE